MPRTCTICHHPKRVEIDTALIGAGHFGSIRDIAGRYGVSKTAVHRHLKNCLPNVHEVMRKATAEVEARSILQQMAELHQRTLALLTRAEDSGQLDTALKAVREARGNLEMLGRMDGTLNQPAGAPGGPINITVQYVDKQLVTGTAPRLLEDGE